MFGIAFLVIRWKDVMNLGFKWSDHAYGSIVWTIIGMHTFHMLAATDATSIATPNWRPSTARLSRARNATPATATG